MKKEGCPKPIFKIQADSIICILVFCLDKMLVIDFYFASIFLGLIMVYLIYLECQLIHL